jgi:WD40 repeat protein
MDNFRHRSPDSPAVDRLPMIVWSRLFFDLEPYLSVLGADGTFTLGFYHRQVRNSVEQEFMGGREGLQRARHLARYFEGLALAVTSDGRVQFNRRKLSELPFLQTHGKLWAGVESTLCDLGFIEAKCAVGMSYDLIEDYARGLRRLPDRRKPHAAEKPVLRYIQELSTFFPKATITQGSGAAPPPFPSTPAVTLPWTADELNRRQQAVLQRPTRGDRIEAFARFVGAKSHLLAEFTAGNPSFCVQEALNSSRDGPIAEAAVDRLRYLHVSAPMLLRCDRSAVGFNPFPAVMRTLNSWVEVDGGVISMTPDGSRAVSSRGTAICLWDLSTGRLLRSIDVRAWVGALALSPDGTFAVSGNGDNTVRTWDLKTGSCIHKMPGHSGQPVALSLTPDKSLAASGATLGDGSVRVWDLVAGTCLRAFSSQEYVTNDVAITADGTRVVSAGVDKRLRVLNVADDRCEKTRKLTYAVESLALTLDGRYLVTTAERHKTILWTLLTLRPIRELANGTDAASAVAVTPDGVIVVGATRNGLTVWEAATGKVLNQLRPTEGNVGRIEQLAVSADGELALSGAWNGILTTWDLIRGGAQPASREPAVEANFEAITHSLGGRTTLAATGDGELVHDEHDSDALSITRCDTSGPKWLTDAAISGDGRRLATAHGDGMVRIRIRSGRLRETFSGHEGYLCAVRYSPEGRRLLAGGEDNRVWIWDLEAGEPIARLKGHPDTVHATEFSPDGVMALSGSADQYGGSANNLMLWNLVTGKRRRILRGHESAVYNIAFSPDGRLAASGGLAESIWLWDLKTCKCLHVLEGHTEEINGLSFSADGRRLISGSRDQTLRIWDVAEGRPVGVASVRFVITCLALSGSRLFVGGQQGSLLEFSFRDPDADVGLTTAMYLYRKRRWSSQPQASCPWCGNQFTPSSEIRDHATTLQHRLKPNQAPSLALPEEAFRANRFLTRCTKCQATLRLNPFVVDLRGIRLPGLRARRRRA